MSGRNGYGSGFTMGLLTGAGIALVLTKFLKAVPAEKVVQGTAVLETPVTQPEFLARREQPEAAGDPTEATGAKLVRGGGAPGPGRKGEQLSMPGRPGKMVDSSRTRKVNVANRALPIRRRKTGTPPPKEA